MKAYRWSRGTAPLILSLCTTWKRVANFTTWLLDLQEITTVPIKWGGPQSRSGGFGGMSLPPFGVRTPHHIYLYVCVCVCVRGPSREELCIIWTLLYSTSHLSRTQPSMLLLSTVKSLKHYQQRILGTIMRESSYKRVRRD